jgi:hypothetical protein
MAIRLKERTPDEQMDIYATGVTLCPTCEGFMGFGYPLWGVHLQAAVTLHAAHRAVTELKDIPTLTLEDRRFGRLIAVVDSHE